MEIKVRASLQLRADHHGRCGAAVAVRVVHQSELQAGENVVTTETARVLPAWQTILS